MNYAIILAAGKGNRMGQDIPKQFIHINNKPVILYTLESFQSHDLIDEIHVVCLSGWIEMLESYVKQYNISKLKSIIEGGKTGQESIQKGVFNFWEKKKCNKNDIIIIHDGIRPLIEKAVLTDVITKCETYGNAVTSMPYTEQIFKKNDNISTKEYIPRDLLIKVATPQAYKFEKLFEVYKKVYDEKIELPASSYTNTLMVDMGETLYLAAGSEKNIKLTTVEDIEIFKALLETKKDTWIK